ncbi:MAG: DUF485 domain-containing protein [Armatimonadota bacterium]
MTYEQMQARQLKLSGLLAIIFLVTVFSVPFLNQYFTEPMLTPVMGIPFAWLLVGILFHIEFWIIAFVYVTHSNRWEREVVRDGQ